MENQTTQKSIVMRILQWIPLLALAIAITGLLITVAAHKKELTCTFTGSTRLVAVSASGLPGDVRMEYRGEPVQSLTKLSFLMKNTGAAAIKIEDVRDPVRLIFPPSVRVLSAIAERTGPQSFAFNPKVTSSSHEVELNFQLLNSGDEAAFSVYIINSEAEMPGIVGRIVDVPRLIFVNDAAAESGGGSQFPSKSHAVRSVVHWTLVVVHTLIVLLLAFGAGATLVAYVKFLWWRRKWGVKHDRVVLDETRKLESRRSSPNPKKTVTALGQVGEEALENRIKGIRENPNIWLRTQLKEANIPEQPDSIETFGGVVALFIGLSGLTALFAFTAYVAHLALRG